MGTTGKTFDVIPQVPKSSHNPPPPPQLILTIFFLKSYTSKLLSASKQVDKKKILLLNVPKFGTTYHLKYLKNVSHPKMVSSFLDQLPTLI